jgi:hypothetical protein
MVPVLKSVARIRLVETNRPRTLVDITVNCKVWKSAIAQYYL